MKSRPSTGSSSSGSRRPSTGGTGGTDGRSLEAALAASSVLLWVPYTLAAMYVAYCSAVIMEVPLRAGVSGGPVSPSMAGAAVRGDSGIASPYVSATAISAASSAAVAAHNAHQLYTSDGTTTAFGAPAATVLAYGSVENSIGSVAASLHRHSAFYYHVFPVDFDIAVFLPLFFRVLCFSVAAVLLTYYLSAHKYNGGEYLMALAWALGTCSGYGWLTAFTGTVQPSSAASANGNGTAAASLLVSAIPPSWLWLAVSLLTGFFSGILCKVKDIVDGKHDRDTHLFPMFDRVAKGGSPSCGGGSRAHASLIRSAGEVESPLDHNRHNRNNRNSSNSPASSSPSVAERGNLHQFHVPVSRHLVSIGDRLYMVLPFCTGQWFAFILHHGWRGIVVENGTILLSLSLVGYTMLSYKFLKRQVLRASGRVSRSVAARSRTRRHERRLRAQQQQQSQSPQSSSLFQTGEESGGSSTTNTPAGDDGAASPTTGSSSNNSGEEGTEMEVTDFFEDVGEVAFIDVIDLVSKLFTTSFGVVVLVVIGLNIFMTSLCIPFLKALFKLNALVSGAGIVIELIMYEVA